MADRRWTKALDPTIVQTAVNLVAVLCKPQTRLITSGLHSVTQLEGSQARRFHPSFLP